MNVYVYMYVHMYVCNVCMYSGAVGYRGGGGGKSPRAALLKGRHFERGDGKKAKKVIKNFGENFIVNEKNF